MDASGLEVPARNVPEMDAALAEDYDLFAILTSQN
jgi:hypothetical protein